MLNGLLCHHLTHIGSSGWITDHCGTSTNQSNWLIATHLQTLHQAQCHKVPHMQGVCRAVKADVERGLAVVDHLADLILVGDLCDQAARHQFLINTHSFDFLSVFSFVFF